VREESHLDDMRSAIRGDFERLAERRGSQELLSASDDEPEHEQVPEPEPEPEHAAAATGEVPRSLLDRLLGRSPA
jgi:hypothetical protein